MVETQRLYLAKGEREDDNIYVDTVCLPQHQYDGIRFLYKQFKKGKAGAILNDPSGYGKRVQTVLFLNAMHPLLTLPILILCTEGKEQIWTRRFNKWTNMGPDVSIQKNHDIVRPVCMISTFIYISILSRRDWSVVVVDDNNVSRDLLRSGLNTKFKIWLTSMDMKKNLQTFSLIYKWFYPKDRFIVEDYQATKKTPSVLLAKSIKLDAFMDDVVLRRKDVVLPLGRSSQTPHTPIVSRKNKDASGRKIKRSKHLAESQEEDSESLVDQTTTSKVSVQLLNNGEIERNNESTDDFVVNIDNEEQERIDVDFTLSDMTSKHNNKKHSPNKLNDKEETQEKMDVMQIEYNNVDNKVPNEDLVTQCDSQDNSCKLFNSETIHSQNFTIKYDSDTPEIDDEFTDIPVKKIKYTDEPNCRDNKNESEDLFSIGTVPSDISESKVTNDVIISDATNAKINEIHDKNNKLNSEDVFSVDLPLNEVKDEIKTDNFNCIKNEVIDKNNVKEINKTEKLDGVELKMKQMEELAMKKFKGSFLDNIF